LPNVGPYIYDVNTSGFTRSSIYIYKISSLRVKMPSTPPNNTFMSFVYYYYRYSALGPVGQRPEFSQATGMALVRCILGKFLAVACHSFRPLLDVPTFATRCIYVRHDARDPSGGRWNCGRECRPVILPK